MYNQILYFLAQHNASFRPFDTTTGKIAKSVGSTQQTISRRLIQLENKGLIDRRATPTGVAITLTSKAIKELKQDYILLKSVFEACENIEGTVISGLGEGRYYMGQEQYQIQFREKLGFFPWAGTLNIRVKIEALRRFLINEKPIFVEGFVTKERGFGGLWCYPITLNGTKASILIPLRSTHPEDVIEIIAPYCVREKYDVKDGHQIKVEK